MVIDTLANSNRYEALHPRFKAAFDFLRRADIADLPPGRIDLDGDTLFALPQTYETKPVAEGKLEAHRKYIDIQFIADGQEAIGYAPLADQPIAQPYDGEKDIAFYDGEACFTQLRKGMFAIFFPQDAHLPSRFVDTPSVVKKIVIKLSIST